MKIDYRIKHRGTKFRILSNLSVDEFREKQKSTGHGNYIINWAIF